MMNETQCAVIANGLNCVELTVNSKRCANWAELGRQYAVFSQERNHPFRYSPISAHKLRREGPSKNRLQITSRPGRPRWPSSIHLPDLRVGLQPKLRLSSGQNKPVAVRIVLRSQPPTPAATPCWYRRPCTSTVVCRKSVGRRLFVRNWGISESGAMPRRHSGPT